MQVDLNTVATRQLNAILAYLSAENPTAANRLVARIQEIRQLLADNPFIGRKLPGGRLRRFTVRPFRYLIYYEAKPDVVRIIRIRHSAQYRKALHEPVPLFVHQ